MYDMVSATCTVNKGDLPIAVFWLFQSADENENKNTHHPIKISTNNGILITRVSARMSTLSIESVRSRHRGNYTCNAKNSAGSAHFTAELLVNGTR